MWQDYTFTGCAILFGYSLIPQIYRFYKKKSASQISWQYLILQSIATIIAVVTTCSLSFYITSVINSTQLFALAFIGIQKYIYKGNDNVS